MREETVTGEHSKAALDEGIAKYPRFALFGPRLVKLPLRNGSAYVVRYATEPPKDDADAWEFQNVVVKTYKARIGA